MSDIRKGKYVIKLNSSGLYDIVQYKGSLNGQDMLVGTAFNFEEGKVNIMNRYKSGVLQYILVDNIEFYYVV